ncbi:MAG: hypothetical protein RL097_347 [Candidatus Parcubacteria bacterium]|jgi:cell wall-associated NlpC family hydrolase
MRNNFWRERVSVIRDNVILLFIVIAGFFLVVPQVTQASIYEPTTYTISSYDYVWNLFFMNGIPDIHHNDTVTISYGKESNMDIIKPAEVTSATARLYYVSENGERRFEYLLYDPSRNIVPRAYQWTRGGQYEVDVYGYLGTATLETYLTTMKFTVVLRGAAAPTCIFTATPSTIAPKTGQFTTLEWTSTNATTATINQEVGVVGTSGTVTVSPNATTTYTAHFTGEGGTAICQVTVNVPDPVVPPLHERAAAYARTLVNHTEAYLWGGKGWDYDLREFTTAERILSGYTYVNPDTGAKANGVGVDCSGLITWAYNRANDPSADFNSNYIKYVNADGLFREYQSDPVEEAEIRAGDTMTFDWNNDGRMDHVAMYVGESGGYDVVNAGSPVVGIIQRKNSDYKLTPGFAGYRRIHQADVAFAVTTGSPVDLEVIDPDGNVLSADTVTASEQEYIREIPGELYYLELTQGHDGRPEDTVISPKAKNGTYVIKVIPEASASPDATYSLTVELNGVKTKVVDNEAIDTIQSSGFTLKVMDGKVQTLGPAIKGQLEELYRTIEGVTLSSERRKQNLLASIESALVWYEKNRTDQIVRKITKLQNDTNRHIANEISSEELAVINQQIDALLQILQI